MAKKKKRFFFLLSIAAVAFLGIVLTVSIGLSRIIEKKGETTAHSDLGDNTDENSTESTNSTTNPTKRLTADLFRVLDSGSYHMTMTVQMQPYGMETMNLEVYVRGGETARVMEEEGIQIRVVIKDGKSYTIMDTIKMVVIANSTPDDEALVLEKPVNLRYIGEGSGEFLGETYQYDAYVSKAGNRLFYYMNGTELKGIRTTYRNGLEGALEILAFDGNVPDSVFHIPSNYWTQKE